MGWFDSFKYVAGVAPNGAPIMRRVKKGNGKGECAAKGHCKEHPTYSQWNRSMPQPLWRTSQFFAEGDVEICKNCKGRIGYLGPVRGPNNDVPPCSC